MHGSDSDWYSLTAAGDALLQLIASGRLQAETYHVHDFALLPTAPEALEHRNFSGKPLVRIAS